MRIIDADGALLGWAETWGEMPGDGTVRLARGAAVAVERSGAAARVNVHWVDLNVNATVPIAAIECVQGQIVEIQPLVALSFASSEASLPAVTVGRAVIEVQAGTIGAGAASWP